MTDPIEVATTCPHCGRVNTMHDSLTTKTFPNHGDISLCWGCHGIAIFINSPLGLAVRLPTDQERTDIEGDPRIAATFATMRIIHDPTTY